MTRIRNVCIHSNFTFPSQFTSKKYLVMYNVTKELMQYTPKSLCHNEVTFVIKLYLMIYTCGRNFSNYIDTPELKDV